jgi:hypothetical protein
LSPAAPFYYLLAFMAENSAAILAVVGTAGLAYILTRPENQRAINSSLSNLSQAIGQVENQVANLAVPAAIEALKQLDQTKQQLKSFQEKLALIDKVLPIAKEYLGKVTRLLQKLDQVSSNLSDKVRANPLNTDPAVPSTYSNTPTPSFPAVPDVDSGVRDRGTREVQRQMPPVSWPKPNPVPSNRPTSRDGGNPVQIPPLTPSNDYEVWRPRNNNDQVGKRPGDLQMVPDGTPPIQVLKKPRTVPPRTTTRERAKPKTDTNQPGCKDPNSWSEKFKQFLEHAIDQLGQELIQTIADRAGEVFEKAFKARDEAVRKNPDFDKGKPDLKKTLEDSIGKEYDKLSAKTKEDLSKYYDVNDQKDGSSRLSRHKGRANDSTLPPIQIKNGVVIPELLAKNNRLSSGVDLGKEFAKGNGGFNPTKSGILGTLKEGPLKDALLKQDAVKNLIGSLQIHHKIPDAVWQINELTKEIQARINAGNKALLSLNDSSNLIAAYKSPEAKKAYQNVLTEIGKISSSQHKYGIEVELGKLQSTGTLLSDLHHNGSHDGWNERAKAALKEQQKELKRKFKTEDLSKIPDKDLKEAYQKVTKMLGDELNEANRKIREKEPLSKEERAWSKDYCNPKKPHAKPHTKISANPSKDIPESGSDVVPTKTIALANESKAAGKADETQNTATSNYSVKDVTKSSRDAVWAKTIALANKLNADNESRKDQQKKPQIAAQPKETVKQPKRGFEYG